MVVAARHYTPKRVVITGLGIVSSLGSTMESVWHSLTESCSGIGPITKFDAGRFATRIGGEVTADFDAGKHLTPREINVLGIATQYAIHAGYEAFADAGLCEQDYRPENGVVFWGTAYGALDLISDGHCRFFNNGRLSPYFIPGIMQNAPAFELAKRLRLEGSNLTVSTACSSSAVAIGHAFQAIRNGVADIALSGGSEAPLTPLNVQAWCELRAMSVRNDTPAASVRPFSADRDGMVLGEGAGAVILESLDTAQARGARIYAELAGFGACCDTTHVTLPDPRAQAAAMRNALEDSGMDIEEIHFINAHGTGTSANDKAESEAVRSVFGRRAYDVPVHSSKPFFGHLIGASGAVELIAALLCARHGVLHPTLNYSQRDPECDLDYVTEGPRRTQAVNFLSNSFAFGGNNAVLAVREFMA
jgi:3-oxoacyl-[acyl-carrier-protein] synthase II